ncbi:MAG: amino acid ABC transporter permease, partial [Lachnospiraceae bacterium]|nr:amino acid ABC transporter permease [Lachnospiraceae bacterium]
MSMELLTFLQLLYIIVIYLGVVVLIPAAVFHGKFEDHPFYVRYTAYTCIGNFYLMNLVFLLQLLHISNRVTLILGVVIPALIAVAVYHWRDWVKASLVQAGETTHNVIVNTMGMRLFFNRIFQNLGQAFANMFRGIAENLITRWFDWVGTIAIIIIVCWQDGSNLFSVYGYTASDMLVHNFWINAMGDNNIFVAGVYPYGFHAIIYFFHAVFGIETYVMLRLFSLLETMLIHFVLLFILRLVCKTESAAYIATGIYLLLNIWGKNAFFRFYSALPQEYGMIFILPSIFFLILFFRERLEENGEKGIRGKRSTSMLKLFGINVSMTLAIHFYDTIALGIFCVAIGIAFCKVVFRKDVFGRVMVTGIIGIIVAVFPMWFAYFCGTPL